MYNLTLPYPPSVNHYLARSHTGGLYPTAQATAYKEEVALRARLAGIAPLDGAVVVMVDVYRPARRGDLDNSLKVCFDSLNGIAWHDDSQVVEIHASRHDDKANPRVEVTIWAVGEMVQE